MGINLKNFGWDNVKASVPGEYYHIPAGAYVCKIYDAHIDTIKDKGLMLTLDVDIAEGEFTDFFVKFLKNGKWDFNAQFKRYIVKQDRLVTPTFKGLVELLQKQNPNFHFNPENIAPEIFRNLTCGFTFVNREYFGRDGKIYSAPTIKYPCDVEKVRAGKVKIPPDEKIPEEEKTKVSSAEFEGTPVNDDDFPF